MLDTAVKKNFVDNRLLEMLCKFYGLPPHNTFTNICYMDGYFYNSIKSEYGLEAIRQAEKQLNV